MYYKYQHKKTPFIALMILVFSSFIFSCTTNNYNGINPDCSNTSIIVGTTYSNSSVNIHSGSITVISPLGQNYTYKINSGSYQVNPTFSNLAPGTYTITAKNAQGCTGATSVTITSFDCSSTYISVSGNTTTNSITITSPIGNGYTYSINGSTFQSSNVFNGLSTGKYTVTARDINGCTGSNAFDVNICYSTAQRDTGAHTVFIDALNPGLAPIRDALNATFSGNLVHVYSNALNRTLSGSNNGINCNEYALDSIVFANMDTLKIPSTLVLGGVLKIWNVRADGTIIYNSTGCTTKINIAKGNTNITSPINLTNLAGLKLNLRGAFLKIF